MQPEPTIGARENPAAYLPGDRRRAIAAAREIPNRATGAALFIDISGFTQLTEALVADFGPRRGAEQLSATLQTVFAAVLNRLHIHGGSAIYFSGDAVTCWIDGDDGHLALACAFSMQSALREVCDVRMPSGGVVQLTMKVAVAVGTARRFVVGDPSIQLIDVLAGSLVDELATAESMARQGEIVVTEQTQRAVADLVRIAEPRRTATGEVVHVVNALRYAVTLPLEPDPVTDLPEDVCAQWLLPAVYERLRDGNGDFLAELRRTVPLFLRFSGIDYDTDPDAPAKLDAFVVAAQRVVDGYGGNVLQLTIGDKGAYLYAIFGSPIAHEDDSARACAAALRLLQLTDTTAARDIAIGIARGDTRSGTYGHRLRRTFCCLGDAVNLAARLMVAAPAGEIWLGVGVQSTAGGGYEWAPLPMFTVKGKAEPVEAFRLIGERRRRPGHLVAAERPMIGRRDVLERLDDALRETRAGRGQVVGITGEAGLGKSRLLGEFVGRLRDDGVRVVSGECEAFGARAAYQAWRDVVPALLGWSVDEPVSTQVRQLRAYYDRLDPELTIRVPLLGTITGVDLPDNPVTAVMDAKLRKESLELLVVQTLNRFVHDGEPLVLVLDECHGLDPLAQDLLTVVARSVIDLPVLVLLAYRPMADIEAPPWLRTVRAFGHAQETRLEELDGSDAVAIVESVVAQLYGPQTRIAEPFRVALLERTQGNPFHVEEMAAYLRSRGVDPTDANALDGVEVPDSLQSLVLSRVDALPDDPRRAAKVASVVGRTFDIPAVDAVYPEFGGRAPIAVSLDVLAGRDLVLVDDEALARYLFRHVVVREVAYESMPFALRAELHERMGRYLEDVAQSDDEARDVLELLAHHFWHSDDDTRKQKYLRLAGDAAREQFANETAIGHYERLLGLITPEAAEPVLTVLGQVRELVADWSGAAECYQRVLDLAGLRGDRSAMAWARTSLAELSRKQGDFPAAADLLRSAEAEFTAVGEDAGLGRVLHLAGTLAGQQQQIPQARELYERSLVIRRRLGDRVAESGLLANLGIMAEYEGDFGAAIELTRQALALRVAVGDRWAVGHAHSNLGMLLLYDGQLDEAVAELTEAIRAHREVGDRWMTAIGHNNLGTAQLRLGNLREAADNLEICVAAHRLVDDPWSAAHLLEDIAALALRSPRPELAFTLFGAADALRESIGSPRTNTQQAEQDALLAAPAAALGAEAHRLRGQGRTLTTAAAFDLANEVCASCGEVR